MPVFSAKRTDAGAPEGARWLKQQCEGCSGDAPFAHKPAASGPTTAWCGYDKEADEFMCLETGKRDGNDHKAAQKR